MNVFDKQTLKTCHKKPTLTGQRTVQINDPEMQLHLHSLRKYPHILCILKKVNRKWHLYQWHPPSLLPSAFNPTNSISVQCLISYISSEPGRWWSKTNWRLNLIQTLAVMSLWYNICPMAVYAADTNYRQMRPTDRWEPGGGVPWHIQEWHSSHCRRSVLYTYGTLPYAETL